MVYLLPSSATHPWPQVLDRFPNSVARLKHSRNVAFGHASLPCVKYGEAEAERARMTVHKRLHNARVRDRGDSMDSMLRNRGEKDGLNDHELEANSISLLLLEVRPRQPCYPA